MTLGQNRPAGERTRLRGWTVGDEEDIARNSLQTGVVPAGLPLDRWRSPLCRAVVETVLETPDASARDIVAGIAARLGVPADEAGRQLGESLLALPVLEGFTQAAGAIARRMIHAASVDDAERELLALERVRDRGPAHHRQVADAHERLAALLEGGGEPEATTLLDGFRDPAEAPMARLRTGFGPLDFVTGGGPPLGSVLLFAAEAKTGKTCLLTQVIMSALRQDVTATAVLYSGEMSREAMQHRALVHLAQLPQALLERPWEQLSPQQAEDKRRGMRLMQIVAGRIKYATGQQTPQSLVERCRAAGARLLMVDYLQTLDATGGGKGEQRREQVERVSRDLRTLAAEHGLVVLAASATSNEAQGAGEDGRSISNVIRESGAAGYDATGVWYGTVDRQATTQMGDPAKAVVNWRCKGYRFGEWLDMKLVLNRPLLTYRQLQIGGGQ